MKQRPKRMAIVGSGLVGSLLAIYLRKAGHEVTVFDRRPDIRKVEFSGRSINLAMSNRGWKALREVGIEEEIRKIGIPLYQRAMHVVGTPMYYQKYGQEGEAIWSISRGVLNRRMIDLAEEAGALFRFEEKVWDIDLPTAQLFTGESEKSAWEAYEFDHIFGCDGAFSRIRHKMQRRSRFNYSQEFIEVGYKELTIRPNPDGTHKLDKHSFHIWPRGNFMFIAMPNLDGSFNYHSIGFARADSGITSLNDMQGKTFAFADVNSTSGYLVPLVELPAEGYPMTEGEFFGSVVFSGGHEQSIIGVSNGDFDAAVAWADGQGDWADGYNSGAFRRAADSGIVDMNDLVEIWRSKPIPEGPITLRNALPQDVKDTIIELLANLHEADPECAYGVAAGETAGFLPIGHEAYETIIAVRRSQMN